MSGEPGTESAITELEDLQAQIEDAGTDLEACQDDLADMTQRKDELVEAFGEALDQLDTITGSISTMKLVEVYRTNG